MKKGIVLTSMLGLVVLLSSFKYSDNNQREQKILQMALELEGFQEFIESKFSESLVIATNQVVSTEMNLSFHGEAVQLIDEISTNRKALELISMKVKDKKAILAFYYEGHDIKIKLRKDQSKWNASSVLIRGNGYFHYTF